MYFVVAAERAIAGSLVFVTDEEPLFYLSPVCYMTMRGALHAPALLAHTGDVNACVVHGHGVLSPWPSCGTCAHSFCADQ